MSEQLKTDLYALIAEHLNVKKAELVTDDALFVEDLKADSLDTVELVMRLEEKYGVDIPDETAETLKTPGDILRYLQNAGV